MKIQQSPDYRRAKSDLKLVYLLAIVMIPILVWMFIVADRANMCGMLETSPMDQLSEEQKQVLRECSS